MVIRCEGNAYGDDAGRRRLFLAVGVSLLCHALALTSFRHLHVGEFLRDGATPSPLKVELVAADRSYSVDMSTAETEKKADAIEAEPTELAVSEKGARYSGGDGQGPATDARDDSGKARSATVTREVAPVYYPAEMLGRRPIPLHAVVPNYPANIDGVSGRVTLALYVSEKGAVDKAVTLSSDLPVVFEEEALHAFSRARYAPGLIAGKPVRATFVVEIAFEAGGNPTVSHRK